MDPSVPAESGPAPATEAGGRGLDGREAAARLRRDGANVLPAPARRHPARELLEQLTHFFALMLWVAGVLAFVAGLPQLGVAIFVVILVNGTFAFAQERRAERAAESLRDLLPAGVVVRRDGAPTTVAASEVVVGDVVLLDAGDRVPADLTLLAAEGLALDASTLTGESVPVPGAPGDPAFAGTFVTNGTGVGVVDATGDRTELASIADLTTHARPPRTPLARELHRLVRTIALIAVGVGAGFFGLSLVIGTPAQDGFLFAIGVTVALVPEGLLPTVTLSLAMGAQRMAGRNALVRRLEAVETLGSTTFVCSDKTGTITCNQMAVLAVWTPAGSVTLEGSGYEPHGEVRGTGTARAAASRLLDAARAAGRGRIVHADDGWGPHGDPMEAAIDAAAHRATADGSPPSEVVEVRRFAFDPERRRESVLTPDALLVKGAPDSVLPLCAGAGTAAEEVDRMAREGLRVLAVARRAAADTDRQGDARTAERDLELLGLMGLEDPPRPGVSDSIAAARRAGIRLAMVTGDHPATASAIAHQVGLAVGEARILTGRDLPTDLTRLGELLDHDGVVISRVTPADKLRIAQALQARGHVVAMTGDGVNDGPALHAADIGVAMGRGGTDVARAAADLVLLDDDFSTIVAAVEQGRATYTNIHRFLTYHLTDNVAELTPFLVWALSGGTFPLALGVLQVLCLDIGTDLLPALALGNEPPSPGVLRRPPERRHLIDRALLVRVFGVLGPAEAGVGMGAFVVGLVAAGWRPGADFPTGSALAAASGATFAAVVFGQVANAFACRSATRPPWRLGWTSNRLLLWGVLTELVALAAFLLVPPLARLLDHAVPPAPALAVAVAAAPAVLAANALHLRWRTARRARAS